VECAAGVFGNLSSDKPSLKEAIFNAGGVEILLEALRNTPKDEYETMEPLVRSLRHLTAGHGLVERAVEELEQLGGVDASMNALKDVADHPWAVTKAATGLVRNLSRYERCQGRLSDLRAVPRLGQILGLAVKEDKEKTSQGEFHRSSASFHGSRASSLGGRYRSKRERSNLSLVDGVDLADVMEAAIAGLYNLAK